MPSAPRFRSRRTPSTSWSADPNDDTTDLASYATFAALHTISLASPSLRAGLSQQAAVKAVRHLLDLTGADAVAITDHTSLLAFEGSGPEHADMVMRHAAPVLATASTHIIAAEHVVCGLPGCRIRAAVVAPLTVAGRVVGTLAGYGGEATSAGVRALKEVARWVSGQLELAELDASRSRLMEAEMRALRAQISPHFVYNSLTAIASFVRTDPERARDLLLDFADFARYSFRDPRNFTTLAEELRSIDRYLELERARFGDRLQYRVQIAPEVLPVVVPFLSLQPLVENAIRHGMQKSASTLNVAVTAACHDSEAVISIEDDGAGMDSAAVRAALTGDSGGTTGIGLVNVDERMRQLYGEEYGLMIETAPGKGTRVRLRVPKAAVPLE